MTAGKTRPQLWRRFMAPGGFAVSSRRFTLLYRSASTEVAGRAFNRGLRPQAQSLQEIVMHTRLRPGPFVLTLLCAAAGAASATEYGNVVSSRPVVQQVPVSQRVCSEEPVAVRPASSGVGALVGAIAGGVLGHTVGGGAGQAVATGLGTVAGAAIGDRVEAHGAQPVAATEQRCRTVTRYENRTVAYEVVYDYQGVRRATRVAQDPGERIALEVQTQVQVAPVGALPPARSAPAPAVVPPPVSQAPVDAAPAVIYEDAPQVVYQSAPPPRVVYTSPYYVEPAYYNPWPYYALGSAILIGSTWGWHGGYGHYGHYGHR